MTFEMKLREYEDRGREEGRSEGEERVLKLMKRLLDEGKIVEDGSYDELIAKNGYFAELVTRQQVERRNG